MNNSIQVNLIILPEKFFLNQIEISHNQYEKCFEPTRFKLVHSDTQDFAGSLSKTNLFPRL